MKLSLLPKLVENLVWVPVTHLMPYYARKKCSGITCDCPIMPKLASLAPSAPDFANNIDIKSICRDDLL